MLHLAWHRIPFAALTTPQLYAVLQLRSEVFVLEQKCVFQDIDGCDAQAVHVLGSMRGHANGPLLAYARCFPAGIKYPEASIGRVVAHVSMRGTGAGQRLMQEAVACVHTLWGAQPIRIGAQAHLQDFYGRLGFIPAGKPYMEDGIPHVEMLHR
jgi:ElaA protein